jgi:hypothetical protein
MDIGGGLVNQCRPPGRLYQNNMYSSQRCCEETSKAMLRFFVSSNPTPGNENNLENLEYMTAIKDFTVDKAETKTVSKLLNAYGVVKIESYLTAVETEKLLGETKTAISNFKNYKNPYGNCARFSLEKLSGELSVSRDLFEGEHLSPLPGEFGLTSEILEREFFSELIKEYIGENAGFMEVVVFTQDYIADVKAIYGLLHFDRRHQLKFIFYLNDVDKENGAFGCIPGSHKYGEDLYYKAWGKILNLEPSQKKEIDKKALSVSEDEPRYKKIPCVLENIDFKDEGYPNFEKQFVEGAAGSMIIFDTHLLHFGGRVNEGKERWTIKGHTFAYVNKD